MWAAEPHLVERKSMGLTVMVFLVIFACLVYYTKKKVWATIPAKPDLKYSTPSAARAGPPPLVQKLSLACLVAQDAAHHARS